MKIKIPNVYVKKDIIYLEKFFLNSVILILFKKHFGGIQNTFPFFLLYFCAFWILFLMQ